MGLPLKTGTNFLRFEVTAQDGETTKTYTVTVTRLPALKASFAVPESHDGSTPFTVTLKFNEDISSALSNVAAAVVVTNGTKGAVTADGSSTRRFLIPVTPDSSDPVRIRVRNANHCDQSHAVCAVSGKLLKTEFSRWVGAEDDATLRALWLTRKRRLLDPKETGVPAGYHLVLCRGCQWCRRDDAGCGPLRQRRHGRRQRSRRHLHHDRTLRRRRDGEARRAGRLHHLDGDGHLGGRQRDQELRDDRDSGWRRQHRDGRCEAQDAHGDAGRRDGDGALGALVQSELSPGHGGSDLQSQGVVRHDRGHGVCGEELKRSPACA